MPRAERAVLRRLATTGALALSATSCGDSAVTNCVHPPCPAPFALSVTVISGLSGGSVAGAFVQTSANTLPCTQSPGTTCIVPGNAGQYELDIGAPGYQTVHRSVTVTGSNPPCGCAVVNTQHLDVALTPVG